MKTVIEKIDADTPIEKRKEIIRTAGQIIKNAGLVAFPTETVYGLGADALNEEAAAKIYEAKGRPSDNPLIIHISKLKDLEVVASEIPEAAIKLAESFWPGPLTMILNKTPLIPMTTTGNLNTVAVRMPSNELALELIEAAGGFVAAPSANSSGRPSPTSAAHVKEDLDGRIDMILDAGSCNIGLESTIVDLTTEMPTILRPGLVTASEIEEVIGKLHESKGQDTEISIAKAPGMKYRHYAPRAELSLFAGRPENVADRINVMTKECIDNKKTVGIICSDETKELYSMGIVRSIGSLSNSLDIAANLYELLRSFDEKNVDYIFSESFFVGEIGDAIMNRLNKAAGGKLFICSVSIDYSKIKSVIFVDENDVCLAPMAEAVFNSLKKHNKGLGGLKIGSRGISVLFSEPVNPKADAILKKHGMELENHKAIRLSEADITEENTIVAMNAKVKNRIMDKFSHLESMENVYTLSELLDDMVILDDPFGGSLEKYEEVFKELVNAMTRLKDLIEKL